MRKVVSCVLVLCMFLSVCSFGVSAESTEVIYLDDGSYIVTEMQVYNTRATNKITATATRRNYDADDTLNWTITLTATFTYDGVTATCTATDLDVTIYDSSWYVISAYHNRGAANGYANVQLGHKLLGVTVEKPSYYLSLNCTPEGNIS